ncbi:MAG: pyrimidine dimer DNA glycosylase/endonuclease V [Candidatus Competibacteraceae bacterium]
MRLWSLHPKYLDPRGLVALWRETLLAQAVLRGETRGYHHHPQLDRFKNNAAPLAAISLYLEAIHAEAETRGYSFDKSKIQQVQKQVTLAVTSGQMEYEWAHLMAKLKARNPAYYQRWRETKLPVPHPLFEVYAGDVESWERQ